MLGPDPGHLIVELPPKRLTGRELTDLIEVAAAGSASVKATVRWRNGDNLDRIVALEDLTSVYKVGEIEFLALSVDDDDGSFFTGVFIGDCKNEIRSTSGKATQRMQRVSDKYSQLPSRRRSLVLTRRAVRLLVAAFCVGLWLAVAPSLRLLDGGLILIAVFAPVYCAIAFMAALLACRRARRIVPSHTVVVDPNSSWYASPAFAATISIVCASAAAIGAIVGILSLIAKI